MTNSNSLKIKYCSDIHQEINNTNALDISIFENFGLENVDVLIVAGDLAEFPNNTIVCSSILDKYPNLHIIEVPGNHNYYKSSSLGLSIDEIDKICRNMTKIYPNYHYLNNNKVDINGITFIGSTMWTECGPTAEIQRNIQNSLNDFNYILNEKGQTINVQDVIDMHKKSINYITRTVNSSKNKCVIITHHAPFFEYYSSISHAFGIDLERNISKFKNNPIMWVYGHTHINKNVLIGNKNKIKTVCNQRGYKNENFFNPVFNAYNTFINEDNWYIEINKDGEIYGK